MKNCEGTISTKNISFITNHIFQSQRDETVVDFLDKEIILKFLFRPVLSISIANKGFNSSTKSHKKVEESSSFMDLKIDLWMDNYDKNLGILEKKLLPRDSEGKLVKNKSFCFSTNKKFRFTKALIELIDTKILIEHPEEEIEILVEKRANKTDDSSVSECSLKEIGVTTQPCELKNNKKFNDASVSTQSQSSNSVSTETDNVKK